MTPQLLNYLCEPVTKAPLQLVDSIVDADGNIQSGGLIAPSGKRYPIINGIPRFIEYVPTKTVESFGDEWNYFNFTDFKVNWLTHTIANTSAHLRCLEESWLLMQGGGAVRRPSGLQNMALSM